MERKAKAKAETGVYLAIVAAILVVANLISFNTYGRLDLTKNERFTLSQGSARLVREGLTQDLQIDVYVTRGLAKHELFIQDLTDLLGEYERASNGKLRYTVIEPKTDDEKQAARDADLQEAAFGEGSETGRDQATITKGFMGMAFKYGSEKASIPILSPDASMGLEFWITNKIRELRDRADNKKHRIGVVTGKDEIKLSDTNLVPAQRGAGGGPSMKQILEQALPFYAVEELDLKDGNEAIDKELVGVIITQPAKAYTEKELQAVDAFLMEGNKSLLVVAGAVNLKAADASLKAELNTHGLEKLLDGYGIEMKKEALLDFGRPVSLPIMTQSGLAWFRYPAALQLQHDPSLEEKEQLFDDSFAGFFRVPEIVFPFPSTLVAHPEKQPGAKMKTVARSTARSWAETADNIDLKIATEWRPKGEYGQRDIAITVEGKLKSAFAAGESKADSRVLVIASPQFLANPFARAGNAPPMPPQMAMLGGMGGDEELLMLAQPYAQKYLTATILAFKNTLDWMAGDSDLIAASAKLLGETNLTYSSIAKPSADPSDDEAAMAKKLEDYRNERHLTQQKVQWTLTLFGPLAFAAFGIIRWRRREAARETFRLETA